MGVVYEEEISYISSRIRELRKERRLTVQELAYRCDMERSNLSRIEAGRTNLTVKTMCIICNALSVKPARCNSLKGIYLYLYIPALSSEGFFFWAFSVIYRIFTTETK